jgi:putative MATE family efflux protein
MPASASDSASTLRLKPVLWPLMAELSLGIAVGWLGTALAARQGDSTAAALGLALHVVSLLFIVFRIVGAGVSVVVAQSLGAGDAARAERLARAAVGAATVLGGALAVLCAAMAEPLLRWMQAPVEVREPAARLLLLMAPGLLLDAWVATLTSVLRAHLQGAAVLRVSVLMHCIQMALLAWALPRWGLAGFAVAWLASRALALGWCHSLWQRVGLRLQAADVWRLPRAEVAALLRIGGPGAAENILYRLAFFVSVAAVSRLGETALAAHTYATQLSYWVLVPGLALGLSVEIVVAHHVGAGERAQAHAVVRRALAWGLPAAVLAAAAMAAAAPWALRGFTRSPDLLELAGLLLLWQVLVEPGRTLNLVLVNALRAAGDVRYPVQAGAASMVLVLAGGSWLLGSTWGVVGVWLAYAADEWLRGLLMARRWWHRHSASGSQVTEPLPGQTPGQP